MGVRAEDEQDTERTRAEIRTWVSNLDTAIADLRAVIDHTQSEEGR